MRAIKNLFILLMACSTSACMTYHNFPEVPSTPSITPKHSGVLVYQIEGSALFAGPTAIRNVVTSEAPYASSVPTDKEVKSGDYLHVSIAQTSPSMAATVFGYISYSTLTILPFWSNQDGSVLTFMLYRNGALVSSKEYVINRGTFVWLGMLPFAWVNFMTPSEEQAFAASTSDFLHTL